MLPENMRAQVWAVVQNSTMPNELMELVDAAYDRGVKRGREDERKETMDCLREMAKNASEDYDLTEQGVVVDIIERIEAMGKE